jgi:hyperosmotically inducible periplasmic protein
MKMNTQMKGLFGALLLVSFNLACTRPLNENPERAVAAKEHDARVGAPQVDNTKIDQRDREGTLTPLDQGNSGAEIAMTASIRREIVGNKNLSTNAKNVKVIAVGSAATLRGPVQSEDEKSVIGSIATNSVEVTTVDNQLEVKP